MADQNRYKKIVQSFEKYETNAPHYRAPHQIYGCILDPFR